jgi:glutathione synthase/RimK-type ligase-like ATP-grasp enzyme
VRDRVLLAVDAATADLTADDRVLAGALGSRGVGVRPVIWGDPLPAGSVVVLRSVYDHVERPDRFRAWLATLEHGGVTVHNHPALVRWNMHKGYLVELGEQGVPIVPTAVVAAGGVPDLAAIMDERRWSDAVVKPAIGGTARHTIHVGRTGRTVAADHLRRLAASEDALVQAFVPAVVDDGELSVIAVAGAVTHVVRKRPAPGDWRVQAEFGGTSRRVPIDDAHLTFAARVLDGLASTPLYARIDVVADGAGGLLLLELELVEPELFLRLAPDAASRLADAIMR